MRFPRLAVARSGRTGYRVKARCTVDWGWLVPVIILLIWIINYVLRGNEETRSTIQSREAGSSRQTEGRTTRRSPTEIDRFLDEVNRRRRQAAERGQAPRSRQPTAAPAAKPAARPPRTPSGRPAVTPRVGRTTPGRAAEPMPVVEAVVVEALSAAAKAPPPSPTAFPPPPASDAGSSSAPTAMDQLSVLLGTPDSLRTAIMLHEILGPPRCQRHGLR